MTDRKLFYEDPALDHLETRVIESGEGNGRPWVRLEETIFYPEGGGQPADRGTIAGVAVVDVQSRGVEVLHFLGEPVPVGPVTAVLDAARRFELRQQHTAQHLLTAVLAERHGQPTTSFHLGESYASIDVEGSVPSSETLCHFEEEVNALIREDLPVRTSWVAPEAIASLPVRTRGLPEGHTGPVRLVEIEGIDLNTCGGTHVSHLAEIQMIHLTDAEPARGGARVRFLAGQRALRELLRLRSLERDLKARIGTSSLELVRVLDGWQSERKELERKVRDLEKAKAGALAADIAAMVGPRLARFLPDAGPDLVRAVAAAVVERRPDATVVIVGEIEPGGEACFVVQAGTEGPSDVVALGDGLKETLGSRGGGKGRIYQGRGGKWPGEQVFERLS